MTKPFRLLVTGSRTWPYPELVVRDLESAHRLFGRFTLVHGHCPQGADRHAHDWATMVGPDVVDEEMYPADWSLGKGAGFIRNTLMVKFGADLVLAYIHADSRGATHCASQAEKAGLRIMYRRQP